MAATMFLAANVLLIMLAAQTCSALSIVATTFPDPGPTNPNTFVATSDAVGSSLLGSGVASLLWLIVQSSDVTAVCQQIVGTGSLSFSLTVTDSTTGSQTDLTLQIESTGGCEAAPDESGTEMVAVDNLGRKSALVCPQNAGSLGCGVYITGDGITQFYNQGLSRRRLFSVEERIHVMDCDGPGFMTGFFIGYAAGWQLASYCSILPPPQALFCSLASVIGGGIVGAIFLGCTEKSSCFPGDATLQLAGGISKSMSDLDLGDKVAVWKPDGSLSYEDIYGFGHRDATAFSRFHKISMNSSKGLETSLELSGRHFAPISSPGIAGHKMVYLRAQEIQIGDTMWGLNDNAIAVYTVTGISIIMKKGIYNPFTMTGTIVVNGVVASVHSDWFLDETFDVVGLTHLLPTTYQVTLAPVRMLYKVIGKESYSIAYDWLEQHLNLVQHISDYSGMGATLILAGAVGAPLYFLRKSRY